MKKSTMACAWHTARQTTRNGSAERCKDFGRAIIRRLYLRINRPLPGCVAATVDAASTTGLYSCFVHSSRNLLSESAVVFCRTLRDAAKTTSQPPTWRRLSVHRVQRAPKSVPMSRDAAGRSAALRWPRSCGCAIAYGAPMLCIAFRGVQQRRSAEGRRRLRLRPESVYHLAHYGSGLMRRRLHIR